MSQSPNEDRKSVVQGKSVDLGGRRIIKKKKKKNKQKKKKKESTSRTSQPKQDMYNAGI